jgi:phosphate transport system substrate-binding protein
MRNSRNFSNHVVLRSICAGIAAICGMCSTVCAHAQQPTSSNGASTQVIRVWGYSGLSAQLLQWEAEYRNLHPEVRFDNQLHGAAAVMAGLYDGAADVALMGREIWPVETMAYQWVYQQQPFGVIVATAGLRAPGQLFTPVVIVNAKNPLTSISLSQLDAIYGSEHRAAPTNIRTWGELGAKGEWADKPIHPYGFGGEDALGVFFRHEVLRSDFKPNPDSHLLSDHDSGAVSASRRIAQAVAADQYAIGYTSLPQDSNTKVLSVESPSPSPVQPTEEALLNHRYALTRSVWLYFRRVPGKPVDPRIDGFVRFLLSPKAQALVRPSDELLPLTPALQQKQVEKLDRPIPKSAAAEEN